VDRRLGRPGRQAGARHRLRRRHPQRVDGGRAEQVVGIDLAGKALGVARLHALESGVDNIDYREVAAETLAAEAPQSFEVVTCMEMLEHVPDPASVVRACAALVRPNGWVFFRR
jgi:2-polyprenyl-6-hydroxyphenyl methylase/3-demethylubiquinone-9 3-methyltransferase